MGYLYTTILPTNVNIYRVPTTCTDVEDIVGTKMDEVPTLSEPQ